MASRSEARSGMQTFSHLPRVLNICAPHGLWAAECARQEHSRRPIILLLMDFPGWTARILHSKGSLACIATINGHAVEGTLRPCASGRGSLFGKPKACGGKEETARRPLAPAGRRARLPDNHASAMTTIRSTSTPSCDVYP